MWLKSNVRLEGSARRLIRVTKIAASCAVLLALTGCMTVTVTDSILINSSLTQDKPVRAGVSTTGEAIGEAIKAAGYGGIDISELRSVLEEIRKLRAQRAQ